MPQAKKTAKKIKKTNIFTSNPRIASFVIVAVLFGAVGAYVVTKSNAQVISGTATACGSYHAAVVDQYGYGNPTVENIAYTAKLKNSDSVRNLAKATCEKGFLDKKTALSVNRSGTWSSKLTTAIRSFEKSDPRLVAAADGE